MQAHSCGLGSIVCSRKHAVGTRTGWCIGSSWGSLRSRRNGEPGCAQLGWVKGLVSIVEGSCPGAMPVAAGDHLQPVSPYRSLFPSRVPWRQQRWPAPGFRLSPADQQIGGEAVWLSAKQLGAAHKIAACWHAVGKALCLACRRGRHLALTQTCCLCPCR